MTRRLTFTAMIFGLFFGVLALLCLWAENSAEEVRSGVLRFHVVANSNSEKDQQNKFAVRDGIANLCAQLFEDSESKMQSMETAVDNKELIELKAESILREKGSSDSVNVNVRKRFFPTRHYEGVSLPAGVYDTIDVRIGNAEGENFWCVMFPAICLGTSSDINKQMMSDVLTDDAAELVTEETPKIKFKFKIVEIIEALKNKF